jgi:hypothetical protein
LLVVRILESSVEKEFGLAVFKKWVEFWRWQSKVTEEIARKELGCGKTSCVI